jgi:hypothetical protein
VPGNTRKPRIDMNLTWLSTIEENQNKKQKKGMRLGGHTTLHTPRFKNWLKNSKLSLILMENKGTLEKFSDQQSCRYKVEACSKQPGRITKVNRDMLSIG